MVEEDERNKVDPLDAGHHRIPGSNQPDINAT